MSIGKTRSISSITGLLIAVEEQARGGSKRETLELKDGFGNFCDISFLSAYGFLICGKVR